MSVRIGNSVHLQDSQTMRATPLMLAIALGLGLAAPAQDALARPETAVEKRSETLSRWIVVFEEPAAGSFRGFKPGDSRRPKLAATSPAATGARKYDARSVEATAYLDYLADLRRTRLADASVRLGRPLEPRYIYQHAMNGVALDLTAGEAARLRELPGVEAVRPDFKRYLQTQYGPAWINADDVWSGAATGTARRGEGIVVGVIDSGINRSHVAFTGAGFTNPLGSYKGYCAATPAACNNKLIGLWDFTIGNSGLGEGADTDGHGTHVAATAAGNAYLTNYTGVAPRANIISYKGCGDDSEGCDGSALIRSIDQAVADGVDVINYSIGGGSEDPWAYVGQAPYNDTEAFLGAREAGVVVAVAAGNDGPNPGTVTNPGNSPWTFGVAAASSNRNGNIAADILASFSGRGPVVPLSVLKPDITAPGVTITAAYIGSTSAIATLNGTSMATPHVAGAAALLKSTNPSLTADQVMSALSLTAQPVVRSGVPFANPHEQGAGRVDVGLAARAGLYMEVPAGSFRNARAAVFTGGAETLNLPTMAHAGCFQSCQLTRSFKLMPGANPASYTVQAQLSGGATITPSAAGFVSSAQGSAITFDIDVSAAGLPGTWVYGSVTLVNTSGDGRPNLRLPVAVYASPVSDEAGVPAEVAIDASRERGFTDVALDSLLPLPNARFRMTDLAVPVTSVRNITVDPTNTEIYDDVTSNYSEIFTIPAGTGVRHRIRVTTRAAAPDIDLFVGRDIDNDGRPDESEELCRSTSAASNETCEFTVNGAAAAQNYWLMAQNWSGAGTNVTVSRTVIAAVPSSSGALVATGPGNVPADTPFAVRIGYDVPALAAGDERLALLLVEAAPGERVIEVPVRLVRSSTALAPFALSVGVARDVRLAPGAAHDTLVFDVPANATSVTFRTQGTGSVSLYAAHVPNPTAPVVAPAPARNAPGVLSATAAGANQVLTVSGGSLLPGRWYVTPVNTGGGVAEVAVSATVDATSAPLVVRGGSYYAPARGGHGIFMYPAGAERAVLWYTYFQDGTPTWYYMQAPQPGADGSWSTPIYRAAWNGSANHLVQVGNAVMTSVTDKQFTFAYNLDGFTGVESMDAFLTGCPSVGGQPMDSSANWFDPARAGSGYSVQVHPGYEFIAAFIYDNLGVPRFLAAERGGAFDTGNNPVQLDQLQGFAPLGAYSAPVRTAVGTVSRQYGATAITGITLDATFANGVAGGWNVVDNVVPLGSTQGCAP